MSTDYTLKLVILRIVMSTDYAPDPKVSNNKGQLCPLTTPHALKLVILKDGYVH